MIKLREIRLFVRRFPLRRPFKFGIAELGELEHLVVVGRFSINGQEISGYAGENLVPRWFVKEASLAVEDEIAMLRRAVRLVADAAITLPTSTSPFEFWTRLHRHVRGHALVSPALLAQLAESLLERALLDAYERMHCKTVEESHREGVLGIRSIADPPRPPSAATSSRTTFLHVRHTVGLGDAVDELPALLRRSGIRRLKIKLAGHAEADAQRVAEVLDTCERDAWPIERVTLDGNENYTSISELHRLVVALRAQRCLDQTILGWIEQPLHRDLALDDEVRDLLKRPETPPMIIDESDDSPAALPRALALGYSGTTHKNCKGVFNSLAHRAALEQYASAGHRVILSGEDLTIVAPWSQASDLRVAAMAGVIDIERNGQHFAEGLSGFGEAVSKQAVDDFPELYSRRDDGVVELRIGDGMVAIPSQTGRPPILSDFDELAY